MQVNKRDLVLILTTLFSLLEQRLPRLALLLGVIESVATSDAVLDLLVRLLSGGQAEALAQARGLELPKEGG